MKHSFPARTMIGIAALLLASGAFAADMTEPMDRDSKALLKQMNMELKSMLPSKGNAPKASEAKPAKVGVIKLKGLSHFGNGTQVFDSQQLARFLELGMNQSHNKTWEQGWTILRDNLQTTLNSFPTLPDGVRLALQSGLDNAYDKTYQAGYQVMYLTMRTVANSGHEFANPATCFSAYLRLARNSAYEKSWEHGWAILKKFQENLKNRGSEFIPTPHLRLALEASMKTAYDMTYQAGYEAMHSAIQVMENAPMGPLATFYYQQALNAASNKSYEHGWKILGHYIDLAVGSGLVQPFEKLTLEQSRKGSYGATYQAGWEVMRDGLNALKQ